MVGGRGVRGRRPGVVGVAVASSSRRILEQVVQRLRGDRGIADRQGGTSSRMHSPRAVQRTQDRGFRCLPIPRDRSLYVGTGASVPPKRMSDGAAFSPV